MSLKNKAAMVVDRVDRAVSAGAIFGLYVFIPSAFLFDIPILLVETFLLLVIATVVTCKAACFACKR